MLSFNMMQSATSLIMLRTELIISFSHFAKIIFILKYLFYIISVLYLVCCIAFNKLKMAFTDCFSFLDRYFHWGIFYYIFQNSYSIDIKYKYALVSHCVTMIYTLLLYFAGFLVNQTNFYLFIYLFIYLFFFWGGRYVILKQRLY